jgi:hypothetical protein
MSLANDPIQHSFYYLLSVCHNVYINLCCYTPVGLTCSKHGDPI